MEGRLREFDDAPVVAAADEAALVDDRLGSAEDALPDEAAEDAAVVDEAAWPYATAARNGATNICMLVIPRSRK